MGRTRRVRETSAVLEGAAAVDLVMAKAVNSRGLESCDWASAIVSRDR
jgi:hypothetical protein